MKIYSLNKMAYLIMHDVDIKLCKEDTLIYATVDYDVSDLLDQYNVDLKLHQFTSAFNMLRNMIKELNK